MRKQIRFNETELAELEVLKSRFQLQDDSKAIKLAVEWVNHYLQNVTKTFFPPSFDIVLLKRTKKWSEKEQQLKIMK